MPPRLLGGSEHMWQVYYYMDKGGRTGDTEDLTMAKLAEGLAKAHAAGCQGPPETAAGAVLCV